MPLAFVAGLIATRLGLPAIVGYLATGILVGPFTPGIEASAELAPQLAEIGVILLMFGVGIHFSLKDLLAARKVAIPGAVVQSTIATLLAVAVTQLWGWDLRAGLVLGFALSVASTVVLLRALLQADLLDTTQGKIAVGWLIVEDLFTVLALVFLPVLATDASDAGELGMTLATTLGKVIVLVVVVVVVGSRVVPWLLVQVSKTGSSELFTLAVLAIAFGIAYSSAEIFGVSMALGAFLGGLVMGESDLSHQAAEDALPMRNAFGVLFFISVGMLFDPGFVLDYPVELAAVTLIVILAKPLSAIALVALLRHPIRTGLVVGAGLAQIGEFSFILGEMGSDLGVLPAEGHSLILAVAIVSIAANPLLFSLVEPLDRRFRHAGPLPEAGSDGPDGVIPELQGHVVLCGYGRVGRLVADALQQAGATSLVVEQDRGLVEALRSRGLFAIHGDAAEAVVQAGMQLSSARLLIVAIPDPIGVRRLAEVARDLNPTLPIVARTHSPEEWAYLQDGRVDEAILGEHELARTMARRALHHLGLEWDDPTATGGAPPYGLSAPASAH